MLIAVAGSQGSGKSTLLREIAERGYSVVTRKTSRSIMDDWGVTLQEVNNDHELTVKFQEEITKRKYQDEIEAAESSEVWFTERTHTDLFVYALIAMGKENNYSNWIDQYYETCKQYNQMYGHVVYLKGGQFDVENDGVRGINGHYSKMVDMLMDHYNTEMISINDYRIIDFPDLEVRTNYLEYAAKLLVDRREQAELKEPKGVPQPPVD